MIVAQDNLLSSRCTLCPNGCEISLVQAGPDTWKSEYPLNDGGGVCPRGSALGELLCHRNRIMQPARRVSGKLWRIDFSAAWTQILLAVTNNRIAFLLDGTVSCEQMTEAANWCRAWGNAEICFVIEPADEQLLLGIETSGAEYLCDDELASCDGFVIIGDAFAANPTCARGVFETRKQKPKTPIVVIDPASGTAAKFATHRVDTAPGMELQALTSLAAVARVGRDASGEKTASPSVQAAGKAIARCKRLAVLIAAEYGRSNAWQRIGHLAGKLAEAFGGGVGPQTVGANALAAVRLAKKLGAISLASGLLSDGVCVAIGCDVSGMLGRRDLEIFAAAAALPNVTTDCAEVVLPLAMAGELGGTYLFSGAKKAQVAPLIPPPAGVPTPVQIVAGVAKAARIPKPEAPDFDALEPVTIDPAAESLATIDPPKLALLLGRQAKYAGCGALTAHSSWQSWEQPCPDVRVSQADARRMNLKNLTLVTVCTGDKSLDARLRISPELPAGTIVLPEGLPQTRALVPCFLDSDNDTVFALPAAVSLTQLPAKEVNE